MQKYKIIYKNCDVKGIITLELVPLSGEIFEFKPGQFCALNMLNEEGNSILRRTYSLTTSPSHKKYLRFGIKVRQKFSKTLLNDYRVGDILGVEGPFGNFVYDEDKTDKFIYYAGGIGITPFMSMINYVNDKVQMNRVSDEQGDYDKEIYLFYSVRSEEEMAFKDELIGLEQAIAGFKMFCFVSDEKPKSINFTEGRITEDLIKSKVSNYKEFHHFICGPQGFQDFVTKILEKNEVKKERIMKEVFVEQI